MTTNYESDHPLYGRDAEWIADCARTRADSIMLEPGIVGPFSTALAHEYNRLKAKDGNRKRAEELYRKGIDNRDDRIADERGKFKHRAEWAEAKILELELRLKLKPCPTPTPLTQIAADVAKIAANVERMVKDA